MSASKASSPKRLEVAYAPRGRMSAVSSCIPAGRPSYSEHEEAKTTRSMPRSTHASPSACVATAFICQFASGSYSAVGSLERPARWMTPSMPSSAVAGMSRTSAQMTSTRSANSWSGP